MKQISLSILMILLTITFVNAGGYKVGDKARDFSLKNVDGSMVSLADYEDAKGIILVFTCNHCPVSKKYEDRIIALDKKYKELGYPVIAINPNDAAKVPEDSYPNMQRRAKEKGFSFPYIYDDTQEIATAYGASRTPHVFILQKNGNDYIVKYIGAIDNNTKDASAADDKYVEEAVDALLKGKTPETDHTSAIGCGIKWKN